VTVARSVEAGNQLKRAILRYAYHHEPSLLQDTSIIAENNPPWAFFALITTAITLSWHFARRCTVGTNPSSYLSQHTSLNERENNKSA